MKKILTTIISILLIFQLYSQSDLYTPKEIEAAYQLKTRSLNGSPGENYFQNTADYDINVEFNPITGILKGNSTIIYKNNSNADLNKIVFKLYPNLYKRGISRKVNLEATDIGEGMKIISILSVDSGIKTVDEFGKLMVVSLIKPISPGESTGFICEWQYQFPMKTLLREGRYLDSTFFVAYWYPRIAVYDDIDGWDLNKYNGEQEFYNDFGNYNVKIKVPDNYLVWASGELQNPEEVYSDTVLNLLEIAYNSNEIVKIIDVENLGSHKFTLNESNIWKFNSSNISDFAFCITNNYVWDATSTELKGKRVKIDAVYSPYSIDFHEVAEISVKSIQKLSRIMGVDYPFGRLTAFNGHYGMEFPMMINDGDEVNRNGTIFITAHEITHSWFPFLVGTNEHRYAFMDEGLVTYLPKVVEDELSIDSGYRSFAENLKTYSYYAQRVNDFPLMVPSEQITGQTYMYISYNRSAMAYYTLEDILGTKTFRKCLTGFIENWSYKHPTAYDMFYTFNRISSEDLNWFWKTWFFSFGSGDIGIVDFSQRKDKLRIDIKNEGGFPVPVYLIANYDDGSSETFYANASIWKDGIDKKSLEYKTRRKVISVQVDDSRTPDSNKGNNFLAE
ncbi:MAG: hypothetical protein C0598_01845 [Marinilabiliales bacterium]|nr:MAG: hypothetical protein C0598_01845 [Marinilabiliales bacterium]